MTTLDYQSAKANQGPCPGKIQYSPLPTLPCYSNKIPPECGSLVIVNCERVDDFGVWGSLPDWGSSDKAYLPIGSVVRERGRGERRAQGRFLKRVRRFCALGKPLVVVASVEGVDVCSSNGIDQLDEDGGQQCESFQVSVTRRGVTEEEEAKAMEASRRIQRCAAIVDRAAACAGVSRLWARRVALYGPYHRSLTKLGDAPGTDNEIPPERAALHVLLDIIGRLPEGAASVAERQLQPSETEKLEVEPTTKHAFFDELLGRCRCERRRLDKPVVHSAPATIGGPKAIAKAFLANNAASDIAGEVGAVTSALAASSALPPPAGCDALAIVIKGAGKYTFSTRASAENEARALSFLETAVARAEGAWEAATAATDNKKESAVNAACAADGTAGAVGSSTSATSKSSDQISTSLMQPSLNVGLIGDVANGKSTLVRAMTGKRTQAHSMEQQRHGMTIRLGFANAAILRCQDHETCGLCAFLPEEDDVPEVCLPPCKQCGGDTEVATRVSFIDCPGHAELMATMLAGASAFDAVILAAAANAPCPSPQAKQHLDALRISRALIHTGEVAIVQTKAELVAKEAAEASVSAADRLAQHAADARTALRCTVANGAPFFPTCAPLGLGLEPLAGWLASFPARDHTVGGANQLDVLRSFDVNFPGKSARDLVGGVLGGSISGRGEFSRGDALEVRPGLLLESGGSKKAEKKGRNGRHRRDDEEDATDGVDYEPFAVRPLQCRCVEVMTGKTALPKATAGGLVALRTSLTPALCADDRLVGAVVGPPGTLPPVWGPGLLLDDVEFIDNGGAASGARKGHGERLKKGAKVRCHAGSATVPAHVVRASVQQEKLELCLEEPLCALKGANVAVEAVVGDDRSGTFRLVAHARIFGGTCCYDGVEAPHIAGDDRRTPPAEQLSRLMNRDDDSDGDSSDSDDDERSVTNNDAGMASRQQSGGIEEEDEERRAQFLEELDRSNEGREGSVGARLSVPSPSLLRDGGAHILIENFAAIAASLRRDPRHLQTYLEQEGALSCARAGNDGERLRVRWRGGGRGGGPFRDRLSAMLRRYAAAFVVCRQCRGAQTELARAVVGNGTELLCRRCNARRFVPKL